MSVAITVEMIKELREVTGAPMGDCKKALTESNGDAKAALEYLQKKSLASAQKKAGRAAAEGRIASYVHHDGRSGCIAEINCESDFVAATPEFDEIVRGICLQIVAMRPDYVKKEDVPADVVANQKRIFEEQARESGKPEAIVPKIAEGKLNAWYADICLLEQAYVKDEKGVAVGKWLGEKVGKMGENIVVRRFHRYELGEGLAKKEDDFVAEVERMAAGGAA